MMESFIRQLSECEQEKWVNTALLIAQELLDIIHLASGAPSRESELGLLQKENGGVTRLYMFVGGPRCIIEPSHSKIRGISGVFIRTVPQNLDKNSILLKNYFFVLIKPCV